MQRRPATALLVSSVLLSGCSSLPKPQSLGPCLGVEVPRSVFTRADEAEVRFALPGTSAETWFLSPLSDGLAIESFTAEVASAPASVRTAPVPWLRRFVSYRLGPRENLLQITLAWAPVSVASTDGISSETPPGTYRLRVRYLAQAQGARVLCTAVSAPFTTNATSHWVTLEESGK